ncbi:MAG: NADH-quinone oxidoreductase subunit A [Proteobacteria bacterium]|nr:NADH-quinone oxidoreductase subunit A [Pseudomonadota bacterium]
MFDTYIPVLVLMFLTAGFLITMLLLSIIFGPRRDSAIKDEPFECGTIATGDARERFGVKFYLVAMIFILFDLEIVFMYPYALQAYSLGWNGFYAMLSFVTVLTVGLVYVWKRGVLDWL